MQFNNNCNQQAVIQNQATPQGKLNKPMPTPVASGGGFGSSEVSSYSTVS